MMLNPQPQANMRFHAVQVRPEDLRPGDLWSTIKPFWWHKPCRENDSSVKVNVKTFEPLNECFEPFVYRITFSVSGSEPLCSELPVGRHQGIPVVLCDEPYSGLGLVK